MLAVAMGLRSGADGGPISVETADIRHVLLAPMSRRAVLFTPIWQRLRSTMFSFGLVGAVVGQLVATELVGSRAAWAASCALYGAIVGALFVGAGVLAHAVHLPRWAASAIGTAARGMAGRRRLGDLERLDRGHRPDRSGQPRRQRRPLGHRPAARRLAGDRGRPSSSSAVSLVCGDRLRLEPLARRGELVSQLRFAATSQDLRTVVLLRRQLRAEAPRNRSWFGTRRRIGERADRRPQAASARAIDGVASGRRADARRNGRTRPRPSVVWRRGLRVVRPAPGVARGAHRDPRRSPPASFGSLTVTASPLFALAAARRRSSSSASNRSRRCRRRSTEPTAPTDCRSTAAGSSPTTSWPRPILLVVTRRRQRHHRVDPRPETRRRRVRHRRARAVGRRAGAGGRHRQRRARHGARRHHDVDGHRSATPRRRSCPRSSPAFTTVDHARCSPW